MLDLLTGQVSFPISDTTEQKAHQNQTWGAMNIGVLGRNDVGLQFRTESKAVVEGDESGVCSPPLWSKTPPRSPHQGKNYYRSLSPASKTQAIERGQRELMEMVRGMPESSYELTLKDLVEHQRVIGGTVREEEEESKLGEEKKLINKNGHKKEKGKGSTGNNNNKKVGNIDSGGFYLKMVFPISLGSNKQKKKDKNKNKKKEQLANSNSSKVSPRTSVSDKDWWKKSHSASGAESESGVSSINSGSLKSSGSSNSNSTSSSSRSNSRHEMSASSCWPFIRRPESLSQK